MAFKVRLTIEVLNECGNVVNHRGYTATSHDMGVQRTHLDMVEMEEIGSANAVLNKLFNINKAIKETINGED